MVDAKQARNGSTQWVEESPTPGDTSEAGAARENIAVGDTPEEERAIESELDRVFEIVDTESSPMAHQAGSSSAPAVGRTKLRPGLRTALLKPTDHGVVAIIADHPEEGLKVAAAPGVDLDFVRSMSEDGHTALVEIGEQEQVFVVGILQTRVPDHTSIKGREISIEGSDHVTIKSGRSALRLRADGSLELLGTRISAVSRGLFRLVGRALRLN